MIRREIFGHIVSNDGGWLVRAGPKLGDPRNTERDVRLFTHVMIEHDITNSLSWGMIIRLMWIKSCTLA
jgi:hypothetical protein